MGLLNILRQFNWVDIFFVIILLRTCYVAAKHGFIVELFRLLGTILAIYLSLHYYINFSDYIIEQTPAKNLPVEYPAFFSFVVLAVIGYLFFVFLGKAFSRFFHTEAASTLNRWGSLILGIARSFLFASLIMFIFVVAPVGYFRKSVDSSYSGKYLLKVAPEAYRWLWDSVMSKFRVQEKFNESAIKIQADLAKE